MGSLVIYDYSGIAKNKEQQKLLSALLQGEMVEGPVQGAARHCDSVPGEGLHSMLFRLRMELDGDHILVTHNGSIDGNGGPQYKIIERRSIQACAYAGWKIY